MEVKMAPIGVMFTFILPKINKEKVKIIRNLYGYSDKSKFGKYIYHRNGILKKYIKLKNSVIVIRVDERDHLIKFFLKYSIKYTQHLIMLNNKEAKKLNILKTNKWENIIEDLKGSPNIITYVDF